MMLDVSKKSSTYVPPAHHHMAVAAKLTEEANSFTWQMEANGGVANFGLLDSLQDWECSTDGEGSTMTW